MEDVDDIIFQTLASLGWEPQESCTSLKQLEPSDVAFGVTCCLKNIDPGVDLPSKLPGSMAQRFKVASSAAEYIKHLEYPGEIGYQTILYPNEFELRKLFMHLVERLPKDMPVITEDATDKLSVLHRKAILKISKSLSEPWLPISCKKVLYGYTASDTNNASVLEQCYNNTKGFQSYEHISSTTPGTVNEGDMSASLAPFLLDRHGKALGFQLQNRDKTPEVTRILKKATSPSQTHSFPILMSFPQSENVLKFLASRKISSHQTDIESLSDNEESLEALNEELYEMNTKSQLIVNNIEETQKRIHEIREYIVEYSGKVNKQEQSILTLKKLENHTDNIADAYANLKAAVDANKVREEKRHMQWAQRKESLEKEIKELQLNLCKRTDKKSQMIESIATMKEQTRNLTHEITRKEALAKKLMEHNHNTNNETGRSSYTKKILHISQNVRRQKEETQKVLADIILVQKDINNLTGKLQRTFSRVENECFNRAEKDAKLAPIYEYVISIHERCGELVDMVAEAGKVQRNMAQLQVQLDNEKGRKMSEKIGRLEEDLSRVRVENAKLQEELTKSSSSTKSNS